MGLYCGNSSNLRLEIVETSVLCRNINNLNSCFLCLQGRCEFVSEDSIPLVFFKTKGHLGCMQCVDPQVFIYLIVIVIVFWNIMCHDFFLLAVHNSRKLSL